ncbi:hypothetical protein TeGR_g6518, partial [Tetraparma gracilis]
MSDKPDKLSAAELRARRLAALSGAPPPAATEAADSPPGATPEEKKQRVDTTSSSSSMAASSSAPAAMDVASGDSDDELQRALKMSMDPSNNATAASALASASLPISENDDMPPLLPADDEEAELERALKMSLGEDAKPAAPMPAAPMPAAPVIAAPAPSDFFTQATMEGMGGGGAGSEDDQLAAAIAASLASSAPAPSPAPAPADVPPPLSQAPPAAVEPAAERRARIAAPLSEADNADFGRLFWSSNLTPEDRERWAKQGIDVRSPPSPGDDPLSPHAVWSLSQKHGGPCGILAAVQAECLSFFTFSAPALPSHPSLPSDFAAALAADGLPAAAARLPPATVDAALSMAIGRIVARAAVATLPEGEPTGARLALSVDGASAHPIWLEGAAAEDRGRMGEELTRRVSEFLLQPSAAGPLHLDAYK